MRTLTKTCIQILAIILLTAMLSVSAFAGVTSGPTYGTSAALVYSSLTNLTSTNSQQPYDWSITPAASYGAYLTIVSGYLLPPTITVEKIQYADITTGDLLDPAVAVHTYIQDLDYTYDPATGAIEIPTYTLDDIVYDPSPYNIRITASGVIETYTIEVTQNDNGIISPAVAEDIEHGSDFTFTVAPDTGWHIADVLADGESVGAVSFYTFTNITSDHAITAIFEENEISLTPTVAVIPSTSPSSSPSPSPSPTSGATVTPSPTVIPTLTAAPSPTAGPVVSGDRNDDTPPTGDGDLSLLLLVLLSISAVVIAAFTVLRKKISIM